MPSSSLQRWFAARAATLADVENAHRSMRGSGPGGRAAARQISQAYAVLLSGQFQGFCRDLHSECADYLVRDLAGMGVGPAPDAEGLVLTFTPLPESGDPHPA